MHVHLSMSKSDLPGICIFFKVKKIWKSETASCFACLRRKNDLQNEKKKFRTIKIILL